MNKILIIIVFVIVGGLFVWNVIRSNEPVTVVKSVPEQQNKENIDNNKMEEWKMYQNKEIGISFMYPNNFNRVDISVDNGETGRKFTGILEFVQNRLIAFGGVTKDYTAARGGSVMDNYGYEESGEKYFIKFVWGDEEVVPSEFWKTKDGEQAIVIRNTEIGQVLSRESVAVFVNISNSVFSGIVFTITPANEGEQVDEKEVEILRQIISSITFN